MALLRRLSALGATKQKLTGPRGGCVWAYPVRCMREIQNNPAWQGQVVVDVRRITEEMLQASMASAFEGAKNEMLTGVRGPVARFKWEKHGPAGEQVQIGMAKNLREKLSWARIRNRHSASF
jgi:hypothetical protein